MTNTERENLAALAREAAALQKVWLREREEKLAVLAASNAEIKRRWTELDKASATSTVPATLKKAPA